MVKIKLNNKIYGIKEKWSELTSAEFYALRAEHTPQLLLGTLSNIPHPIAKDMGEDEMEALLPVMAFVKNLDELPARMNKHTLPKIEKESYEKLELARNQLRLSTNIRFVIPKLAEIYGLEVHWGKPISHIAFQGAQLLEQLLAFLQKYEILWGHEPTDEQKEAGIDSLSMFGSMATVYELAQGDLLKFQDILDQPAEEVYTLLLYKHARSQYEENYRQLMSASTTP